MRPLVREEDVVVFGVRDAEPAVEQCSPGMRRTAMHVCELRTARRLGPAEAARQALAVLATREIDGFWVHLDADVLHDEAMPAVDYRMPDGLWPEELREPLSTVLAAPGAVEMQLTIYNPTFDDEPRSAARALARTVAAAFAAAG